MLLAVPEQSAKVDSDFQSCWLFPNSQLKSKTKQQNDWKTTKNGALFRVYFLLARSGQSN
jgi:hypothetical protein